MRYVVAAGPPLVKAAPYGPSLPSASPPRLGETPGRENGVVPGPSVCCPGRVELPIARPWLAPEQSVLGEMAKPERAHRCQYWHVSCLPPRRIPIACRHGAQGGGYPYDTAASHSRTEPKVVPDACHGRPEPRRNGGAYRLRKRDECNVKWFNIGRVGRQRSQFVGCHIVGPHHEFRSVDDHSLHRRYRRVTRYHVVRRGHFRRDVVWSGRRSDRADANGRATGVR
jgi:hypothetical protein